MTKKKQAVLPPAPPTYIGQRARDVNGFYAVAIKRDGKLVARRDATTLEDAAIHVLHAEARGATATVNFVPPKVVKQ